jgi:hypothetical protein
MVFVARRHVSGPSCHMSLVIHRDRHSIQQTELSAPIGDTNACETAGRRPLKLQSVDQPHSCLVSFALVPVRLWLHHFTHTVPFAIFCSRKVYSCTLRVLFRTFPQISTHFGVPLSRCCPPRRYSCFRCCAALSRISWIRFEVRPGHHACHRAGHQDRPSRSLSRCGGCHSIALTHGFAASIFVPV